MTKRRTRRSGTTLPERGEQGFTLLELIMVMAVGVILLGIAVPTLRIGDRVKVDNAARAVQQELQAARLRAVGVNRRLEVRFNCPTAGQYRIVESGWSDSARCDAGTYPYPAPANAAYVVPPKPRYDGPIRSLDPNVIIAFSSSNLVLQFAPDGRATKLEGGTPRPIGTESVIVTMGPYSATVDVNTVGKIAIRRETGY
jgi:prepilin-type N-terminal cleavage/methylation domain-containing protein